VVERVIGAILAPLPMIAWVLWRIACGEHRWEFVLFLVIAPALAWIGPRTRKLFWGLYPFAILGLVYDAMRFVKDVGVTPERLHICDLRALDSRWFGFADGTTLHDWLQAHPSPILDAICAVPYGTFIEVAVFFAIYLYVKDYPAMRRFAWTFLLVNLCGFVTYHVYPAAPPWYFHSHGCNVDLAAHASEGPNLARVDARMGFAYFHSFYGRSSDVFGAVPSLHVAYPLLVLVFGWPHFRVVGRTLASLFFATMCFAAVYLDHHWVIDVVMGIAYTLIVVRAVAEVEKLRAPRAPHPQLARPVPKSPASRVAFMLATWFGCGYAPFAPGTAGTLGAIPLYLVVRLFGAWAVLGVAAVITVVGLWASSVVVAETSLDDPQIVVIDEVAGVLLVLAASPFTWGATIVGVLLFRLFDQLKPWPAFVAERVLPGGWGVMFDDVFAGVWGAGAMTLLAGMGAL
jgi:phosphatidylglycerophosphatase A